MLARAVESVVPASVALRAITQAELDITDSAALERALASRPDWVINCAAWTDVDAAEEHEREATLINGTAVGLLAQVAAAHGVRVLHISTDYVFDGTLSRPYREDDVPNPQGAYGRSKLAGERALETVDGGRWTVGGKGQSVMANWRRWRAGIPPSAVYRQKKGEPQGLPSHNPDRGSNSAQTVAACPRGARRTLFAFRQRVQTFTFVILPSCTTRTTCKLGFQVRRVLLLACDTLLPKVTPLSQQ